VSAVRKGSLLTSVAVGLAVCVALALLVAPRASSQPDGLERVAIDEGFAEEAGSHALEDLPTADYGVEGVDHEGLSTGLAGILGIGVTFAVAAGAVLLVRRGRPSRAPTGA
jgi:cobalt/nickel transport system permease protein